jgi:hypothetical protein
MPALREEVLCQARWRKIGTFSDWVGLFDDWRKEIAVNHDEIASFKFDTLYGAIDTEEIEFGSYKGRRKWENLRQVPTQQMRDALINMIVYQGDTGIRQRGAATVPLRKRSHRLGPPRHHPGDDRGNAPRMADVRPAVDHFGYSGKVRRRKCWSGGRSRTSACWAPSM